MVVKSMWGSRSCGLWGIVASKLSPWYGAGVFGLLDHKLLDATRSSAGAVAATQARDEITVGGAKAVRCAACRLRLTEVNQRIAVAGRHAHTVFNPAGVVFHVVCFAVAPGCRGVGVFCSDFSWFKGHRWQIAVCARCGEHVGWYFCGDASFTALIEQRIDIVE